jgi:hypothetical protein
MSASQREFLYRHRPQMAGNMPVHRTRLATNRILNNHSTEYLAVLEILAAKEFTTGVHGCGDDQRIVEGELKVAARAECSCEERCPAVDSRTSA